MNSISEDSLTLRWHKKDKLGVKRISISEKKCWFVIAIIIRTTGYQNKPKENERDPKQQRKTVAKSREELGPLCPGRDICERLITHLLISEEIMDKICSNFRKALFSLGEYVSGDEKLFHYTADSHLVRQVLSKPDRIGLWFYQLCGVLSNGMSYMLHSQLHNNVNHNIPVLSVITSWVESITNVGSTRMREGGNPNPHTLLAFDSYYSTKETVKYLYDQRISFTCSVQFDRFKDLAQFLKGPGHKDNTKGEHLGMYNRLSGEVFIYVYDPQLQMAKYNYSWGFTPRFDVVSSGRVGAEIPIYDVYKVAFSACDHFNRNLKDKKWPYSRGGRQIKGDQGKINDFFMACVLQNTFNSWFDINKIDHRSISFKQLCLDLSKEIYAYASLLNDID